MRYRLERTRLGGTVEDAGVADARVGGEVGAACGSLGGVERRHLGQRREQLLARKTPALGLPLGLPVGIPPAVSRGNFVIIMQRDARHQ